MANQTVAGLLVSIDGNTVRLRNEIDKASAAAKKFASETKGSVREANGALALLGEEFGIHLPRHVRSFVASLPGADVFAKLLPAAAVAGLGLAFVEAGKKALEFAQKQGEMGKALAEGFEKMHDTAQLSNDELQVTNDKLEEQIAKLTGRHANNLKNEIDELVVEADKLYKSLRDDNRALSDLLEKNQIGLVAQFMNQAGTKDVSDKVTEHSKAVEDAQNTQTEHLRAYQQQIHALGDSRADAAKKAKLAHDAQVQWDADEKGKVSALKEAVKDLTSAWNTFDALQPRAGRGNKQGQFGGPDQTNNLTIAGGAAQHFQQQLDRTAEDESNLSLNRRVKALTDAAAAAKLAQKAFSDMVAGMLEDDRLAAESKQQIDAALAETARTFFKEEDDEYRQSIENYARSAAEFKRAVAEKAAGYSTQVEDAREAFQEFEEISALQVETGQESQAQRIASLKDEAAKEYDVEMDALQKKLELYGFWTAEYQKVLQEMGRLDAEYYKQQVQLAQDASKIGIGGAINDMVRKAEEVTDQIKSLIESTVDDLNNSIIKELTEPRQNRQHLWKDTGKQIFTGLAKTGLQDAEGSVLKAFGLGGAGKLGTQGNPMWVKVADSTQGLSGLSGLFGSSAGGSGGSRSGGGLGSFFTTALSAGLPFLADGGSFSPGYHVVGERGPEVAYLGSSGYMHSNASLRDALGGSDRGGVDGDVHHHWNIDARGSTDPAAVHNAVNRAIAKAAPQIVAGSLAAQRDMKARRPSMPSGT